MGMQMRLHAARTEDGNVVVSINAPTGVFAGPVEYIEVSANTMFVPPVGSFTLDELKAKVADLRAMGVTVTGGAF